MDSVQNRLFKNTNYANLPQNSFSKRTQSISLLISDDIELTCSVLFL